MERYGSLAMAPLNGSRVSAYKTEKTFTILCSRLPFLPPTLSGLRMLLKNHDEPSSCFVSCLTGRDGIYVNNKSRDWKANRETMEVVMAVSFFCFVLGCILSQAHKKHNLCFNLEVPECGYLGEPSMDVFAKVGLPECFWFICVICRTLIVIFLLNKAVLFLVV